MFAKKQKKHPSRSETPFDLFGAHDISRNWTDKNKIKILFFARKINKSPADLLVKLRSLF
jgi:hypothetical protein